MPPRGPKLQDTHSVDLGVIGQSANLDLDTTTDELADFLFLGGGHKDLTRNLAGVGTLFVLGLGVAQVNRGNLRAAVGKLLGLGDAGDADDQCIYV